MTTAKDKLTKRKRTVAERLINPGEMTLAQLCEAEKITVAELCRYFEEQPFTAYLHRLIYKGLLRVSKRCLARLEPKGSGGFRFNYPHNEQH